MVPWGELCSLVEPHYPKAGNGRRPMGVDPHRRSAAREESQQVAGEVEGRPRLRGDQAEVRLREGSPPGNQEERQSGLHALRVEQLVSIAPEIAVHLGGVVSLETVQRRSPDAQSVLKLRPNLENRGNLQTKANRLINFTTCAEVP